MIMTTPITRVRDTSSGRLKKWAIAGAQKKSNTNMITDNIMFVINIVL